MPHMILSPEPPLRPGDELTVDIYADTERPRDSEESQPMVLRGTAGQRQFDVEVLLCVTHQFDIRGSCTAILKVEADQPASEHVKFTLRLRPDAALSDDATVFAYFFYEGRPCGSVGRRLALRRGSASTASPDDAPKAVLEVRPAVSADLTVSVLDPQRDRRTLQCRVSSPLLGESEQPAVETWHLPEESGKWVRGVMEKLTAPNMKPSDLIPLLKGIGKELFDSAPAGFKETLWKLIDRGTPPKSILIVSQEPYVPWELMIPWRDKNGNRETRVALGVEYAVGRWPSQWLVSPGQQVTFVDSYVIAPAYTTGSPTPLKNVDNEIAMVLAAVHGDSIRPATMDNIDNTLRKGGRSLLHFACHGADGDDTGIQSIYLEGDANGAYQLTSLAVGNYDGIEVAFKKKPLVFLNACEVGRPAISLSGIGGFAKAFVDLGAIGIIAPLWSVQDTIAFDVATRFYREQARRDGRSFARIVADIRGMAFDPKVAKDTYAAYCFYGDPLATPA